jgi:hypothetical protein
MQNHRTCLKYPCLSPYLSRSQQSTVPHSPSHHPTCLPLFLALTLGPLTGGSPAYGLSLASSRPAHNLSLLPVVAQPGSLRLGATRTAHVQGQRGGRAHPEQCVGVRGPTATWHHGRIGGHNGVGGGLPAWVCFFYSFSPSDFYAPVDG